MRSCAVEGCRTKSSHQPYLAKHEAKAHTRCTCGWVGVYWKMHSASMCSKGDTRAHWRVEPDHGPPAPDP